jgi:hypothetical protein
VLKSKGAELQKAFLSKDAQAVSDIFSGFFSPITYYQRPTEEKTFHALVQVLLSAMGFNVLSELTGGTKRMDLCLVLPDQVYLILELKYYPLKKKLTKKEENQTLAALAKRRLPIEELEKCLADLAILKLGDGIIFKTKSKGRGREITEAEENQALAEEAIRSISQEDREKAFAIAARKKLSSDEIEAGLATAVSTNSLESEEMDRLLSETAEKALMAIAEKSYSGILGGHKPKKTIELGLAISGYGTQVKAMFCPLGGSTLGPKASQRSKGTC